MNLRIAVFAKAPVPGRAKTRLAPALGPAGAAQLHAALIRHTLATATGTALPVDLWCHPDCCHPFFRDCAAAYGVALRAQQGADLGARMAHALEASLADAPVVLIGTDCPALTAADLTQTCAALAGGDDAVLGPALDGGYYLIGLRRFDRSLFDGIRWGSDEVLEQTRTRLRALGWRFRELTPRPDIDRPEDLIRLPAALRPSLAIQPTEKLI